MSGKKFLNDGRKVAVLGKLNNTEWIVQEIFVTEKGDEIPSGESFTTKSLHEVPVESYYKKEEKRQKQYIENSKAELERVQKEITRFNGLLSAKKDMLANSPELQAFVGDKANILAMFLTGTVNYLVVKNYGLSKPQKMEDAIIDWENRWGERRYDSIKLVSALGRSGGAIDYRIHQYSDGSGGFGCEVFPFKTHDEAVEKIKEMAIEKINAGHLSSEDFSVCKELKIEFSEEAKTKIFEIFSKSIQNGIDHIEKQIKENSQKQKELREKLVNLKEEIQL